MPSCKPSLAITTPKTATFPADALKSAASVRTPQSAAWREPLSAAMPSAGLPSAGLPSAGLSSAGLHSPFVTIKSEEGLLKTPITPPLAYMDFLKATSPGLPSPHNAATCCPTSPTAGTKRSSSAAFAKPTPATKLPAVNRARSTSDSTTASNSSNSDSNSTDNKKSVDSSSNASTADSTSSADGTANSTANPSAASSVTRCSCDCERAHKSPRVARIDTTMPPSPFSSYPMSAPAFGRSTFPSLKVPISPAQGNTAGRTDSPIRSPFSARAVVSPFDWDAALKKRREAGLPSAGLPSAGLTSAGLTSAGLPSAGITSAGLASAGLTNAHHNCAKAPASTSISTSTSSSKLNIRKVREVVTRTVTYTPRMSAPPKGKKRKVECEGSVCS